MASTDARPLPRKNVAYRAYFAIFDADGDPVSGATGLDSEVSKDGAAFTDCTNEATEIGSSGVYYLDLTQSEMNADAVVVRVQTTSVGAKTTILIFYPEEAGDIRCDTVMISGDSTAADNLESAYDGTGYADGTAQAGAASSITLAAGASATDNYYRDSLIAIIGGTGANQSARLITAYVGSTKVATVEPAWATNPDNTSTYVIIPWGAVARLSTQAKADVNAEVLDVLTVDTFAELSALPGASPTLLQKVQWIYEIARNRIEQTSTSQVLKKADSSTTLGTSTVSDDGTTFVRGRFS